MTQAADKTWASPPPGIKLLAQWVCLGIPVPQGLPPNTVVVVAAIEAESEEALVATAYPLAVAGATVWRVPIMEVPVGGAVEVTERLGG